MPAPGVGRNAAARTGPRQTKMLGLAEWLHNCPMTPPPSDDVRSWFGDIDIYLFDQILRGRFDRRRRVLDAGCGDGRNLVFFLRRGFQCFGIDREPAAVARVRALASDLAPAVPSGNFQAGELDALPWADESM